MGLKRADQHGERSESGDERRPISPDDVLAGLCEGDPMHRAAAAIAGSGRSFALPALVQALCNEEEEAVRGALTVAIGRFSDAEILPVVIPLLDHDRAAVRIAAVAILRVRNEGLSAHVSELLAHPSPRVRMQVLDLLHDYPHPDVPHWILESLREEHHPNVIGTAVDRLIAWGTFPPQGLVELLRARSAQDPYLEFLLPRWTSAEKSMA